MQMRKGAVSSPAFAVEPSTGLRVSPREKLHEKPVFFQSIQSKKSFRGPNKYIGPRLTRKMSFSKTR
jgi:hypothetical protein